MTDLLSSRSEHKSVAVLTMRCAHRSPHILGGGRKVTNDQKKKTSASSSSKPLHRVSFSSNVQTEYVILRSELSEEEFAATWYCKEEFKAMKKSMLPTLKKMAKGLPLDDNDEDPRGLEHKTPQGSRKRCNNRFISLDAVLQEQDRQWEYDRNDPSAIAKVYNQSSAHCLMQAFLKAKEDAECLIEAEAEDDTTSEASFNEENKLDSESAAALNEEPQEALPVITEDASETLPVKEEKENIVVSSNDTIAEKARVVSVLATQTCERMPGCLQTPRVLSAAA